MHADADADADTGVIAIALLHLSSGALKRQRPAKMEYYYLGTESLWCVNWNHLVCRKWKCEVDHPSQPTLPRFFFTEIKELKTVFNFFVCCFLLSDASKFWQLVCKLSIRLILFIDFMKEKCPETKFMQYKTALIMILWLHGGCGNYTFN